MQSKDNQKFSVRVIYQWTAFLLKKTIFYFLWGEIKNKNIFLILKYFTCQKTYFSNQPRLNSTKSLFLVIQNKSKQIYLNMTVGRCRNSKNLKTKIFFKHLQTTYKNIVLCVYSTALWSALELCCLMADSIFLYAYFVLNKKLNIIFWEKKTKHEVLTKKYFSTYLEIFNQIKFT